MGFMKSESKSKSKWNHGKVRSSFLDFFRGKEHVELPSASVVPGGGSDLLFVNAGMNPFKGIFLGLEESKVPRACNLQKCIRVSGKHNDLEDVGHDGSHHTFFEMMGTWSFNDYGRREAIEWAWELLTGVWGLSRERLYVTVYHEDVETRRLWKECTKVKESHILSFGEKDNFWEMGRSGPCGPCTEIHYDLGKEVDGSVSAGVNTGSPRYVELWNLVFIQHNRTDDGRLEELDGFYVDTGMGLERITAVLQGVRSNYETDLFMPLICALEEMSPLPYNKDTLVSYRVIVDHLRTVSVAIADGVMPSNEGRGYVIRRLIRRAVRYGRELGIEEPFLHKLFERFHKEMESYHEGFQEHGKFIGDVLKREEESFRLTLEKGIELFHFLVKDLRAKKLTHIPGEEAFNLYNTYGFPYDLTCLMAKESGFVVDTMGFEEAMEDQKKRSRQDGLKRLQKTDFLKELAIRVPKKTEYLGAEEDENPHYCDAKLLAIIKDDEFVDEISKGEDKDKKVFFIFDKTVFYAEGGGQVGDTGFIGNPKEESRKEYMDLILMASIFVYRSLVYEIHEDPSYQACSEVGLLIEDTQCIAERYLHAGKIYRGRVRLGETYVLCRNEKRRQAIRCNHTATHLLHAALRRIFGKEVRQAGSLVTDKKLRFDFTYSRLIGIEDLVDIEEYIIGMIAVGLRVRIETMSREEAKEKGALAFFEEKYGDEVRVVTIGDENEHPYSVELCGGSHARYTSNIGSIRILQEKSVGAGIRRIVAITGWRAYIAQIADRKALGEIKERLHIGFTEGMATVKEKIDTLVESERRLKKKGGMYAGFYIRSAVRSLVPESINGVKFYSKVFKLSEEEKEIRNEVHQTLRQEIDRIKQMNRGGLVLFFVEEVKGCTIFCGVGVDLIEGGVYAAGEIANIAASACGGKGGGRKDFAQAGGKNKEGIEGAIKRVKDLIGGSVGGIGENGE